MYEWGENPIGLNWVARGRFYVMCHPDGFTDWLGNHEPDDRYRMLAEHPDAKGFAWPECDGGFTDDPAEALRWLDEEYARDTDGTSVADRKGTDDG